MKTNKCAHRIKKLEIDVEYGVSARCTSCSALFRPTWKEVKLSKATKNKIKAILKG